MKKRAKLIAIGIGGAGLVLSSTGILAQDDAGGRPQRQGAPPAFEDTDINGDGTVSLEEFTTPLSDRAARAFERLDEDGDGVLSQEELESRRRGDRPQRAGQGQGQGRGQGRGQGEGQGRGGQNRPAMAFPDENGDGTVSLEEFTASLEDRVAQRFERLDKDGDGSLTKEELGSGRRGPPPRDGQGGPRRRGGQGGPPPQDGQDQPPE